MPGRQPITGPPSIDRCPSAVAHMRQYGACAVGDYGSVTVGYILSRLALRALYRTGLYLSHVGPVCGDLRTRTSVYLLECRPQGNQLGPSQVETKETNANIKISRYKKSPTAETQYYPSSDPKKTTPCTADPKGHVYPTASTPIHPPASPPPRYIPRPGLARYY